MILPLLLLIVDGGAAMAVSCVTPIGPFCPFRSTACADGGPLGEAMAELSQQAMPNFAMEFARLQLTVTSGGEPDLAKVNELADELLKAEAQWSNMLTRMRLTDDFQSREYFKMTAAWTDRQGESLESVGLMMRWQAGCMKAMAAGQPPLPPPPGLDLTKMAQQAQQQQQQGGGGGGASSMMDQMGAAQGVDASPFSGMESAFESDVVRAEYEQLCRDHASIIKLGETYGTFDPLGKLAYLDALEAVEERWDVFFSRFALLGQLNADYVEQTEAFLKSMGGMGAETFREVLSEAHQLMRRDAEEERSRGVA